MEYTTYLNKHVTDGEYLGTCRGYNYFKHGGDVVRLYTETTFKGSDRVKTYWGDTATNIINLFNRYFDFENLEDFEDELNFLTDEY